MVGSVADSAVAARFCRLYGGVVFDAMRFDLDVSEPFVVDPAIGPARGQPADVVIAGPAFTCAGTRVAEPEDIDDLLRLRMLDAMTPGCVQVLTTGSDSSCAHYGDISGRLAALHGAVGAVIDGYTRDARRLALDGFPTFCRGVMPVDAYGRWQVVRYQEDEVLPGVDGDVPIAPGDWVFADADGVLRIRGSDVRRVLEAAEDRDRREQTVRCRLHEMPATQLYEELGRW